MLSRARNIRARRSNDELLQSHFPNWLQIRSFVYTHLYVGRTLKANNFPDLLRKQGLFVGSFQFSPKKIPFLKLLDSLTPPWCTFLR